MTKNVIVGQSGGPTAVINASLYGVVSEALSKKGEIGTVYGMVNGIEGFLNEQLMDMKPLKTSGELDLMKTTPGSYLGSCRYKLPEDLTDEVYTKLFEKFAEYGIGYFFYIGGNDSMDTVSKLSHYAQKNGSGVQFIGIPKTIDNDLVYTDHTPGYGSAAKFVAATVREIVLDTLVYDHKKSVTIVEIMGRHTGWLTAASVLARKFEGDNPVLIYLPEVTFDRGEFINTVSKALETVPNLVVCVSEGLKNDKGRFICEFAQDTGVDTFGHKILTGCGKYLEHLVREKLKVKVRSVELNVSQRCSSAMLSGTDYREAVISGAYGVKAALNGKSGHMVTLRRRPEYPYRVEYGTEDVNLICNREKTVPTEWIINHGSDISRAFAEYALPLIQGQVKVPLENGLPVFAYRK